MMMDGETVPLFMKAPSDLSVSLYFSMYDMLTALFFFMFSIRVCSMILSMSSSVNDLPRKSAIFFMVALLSWNDRN